MKKLFLLTATLGLAFVLAGCKGKGEIARIEYKKEDSINMFKNCKDKDGFYIKYDCYNGIEGNYSFEYAAKNDLYMYNRYTYFYTDLSDPTKCVTTVLEHGEWVTEELLYANTDGFTKEGLAEQNIEFVLSGYLFYFSEQNYFSDYTLTKTTSKIVGRECDKFTYTIVKENAYDSSAQKECKIEFTESIYVDKVLGFCLCEEATSKYTYSDKTKKKTKGYMKCVDLKLDYDLVIPTNE